MTRAVVLQTWCDLCPEDERNQARTVAVAIGGLARELDLCLGHRTQWLEPLEAILLAHGIKAGGGKPAKAPRASTGPSDGRKGTAPAGPRNLPCPFCELTYAASSGLVLHFRSVHQLAGATIGNVFGTTCPLCAEGPFANMGRHTTNQHDGMTVPQAFAAAKAAGDEFGVVAALVKGAKAA